MLKVFWGLKYNKNLLMLELAFLKEQLNLHQLERMFLVLAVRGSISTDVGGASRCSTECPETETVSLKLEKWGG